MAKRVCKAKTKAGKQCKARPLTDSDVCMSHSDAQTKKEMGFEHAGRPRRPREIELIQEVAEEFKGKLRQVYTDGLSATRHVVVGNGPEAHVEEVPDMPQRLKTAAEILDRLHGKPRQAVEMTAEMKVEGVDTAPISRPEHAATVAAMIARAKAPASQN